jgi:hypothetical protein
MEEKPKYPEPFTSKMLNFLLVNALRCLTEEQRAGLCFDLYSRSSLTAEIDKRIEGEKAQKIQSQTNS